MSQLTMYAGQVNSIATTLAAGIDASVTTIGLVDATKVPAAPNIITIGTAEDAETVLYTGKSGNNLTGCTRGFQGTAKSWSLGATVARLFTAYDYDTLRLNMLDYIASNDTELNKSKGSSLDLKYYWAKNVKQIATCEPDELWQNNGWAGTAGTYSVDYAGPKTGIACAKATVANGVAYGGISLVKSLDLTKFNDGSASTTADYIVLALYIDATSLSNLTTSGIRVQFACDAFGTANNYFAVDIAKSALVAGWNYLKIQKSASSTIGTASWSALTGVTVMAHSTVTGQVVFSVDNIQLVRKDPLAAVPNPFQRNLNGTFTRDAAIQYGEWSVYTEFGEVVCRDLAATNSAGAALPTSILSNKGFTDFIFRSRQITYAASQGNKLVWEIDSSNRIAMYIYNGNFSLLYTNAGTDTYVSKAVVINSGDTLDYVLTKSGQIVTATLIINDRVVDSISLTLTVPFVITTVGYLSLGIIGSIISSWLTVGATTTEYVSRAGEADIADTVRKPKDTRNLLLNWDFRNPVNQRAASSYGNNVYTVDRWKTQVATVAVQAKNIRMSPGGVSSLSSFHQPLEFPSKYAGHTLTLTAIIDAFSAGSASFYLGIFYADDGGNHFTPLATIAGAGTYFGSFTLPIGTNLTSLVAVITSQSTTGYVDISRMKLEMGSISTLANDPPMDFERALAACQRFYWKSFPYATAPATGLGTYAGAISYTCTVAGVYFNSTRVTFPTRMRIAPTLTFYNPISANNKWYNRTVGADSGSSGTPYSAVEEHGFSPNNSQVAGDTVNSAIYIQATADAEI